MISWMKLVVSSQLFPPITATRGRGGNGSDRAGQGAGVCGLSLVDRCFVVQSSSIVIPRQDNPCDAAKPQFRGNNHQLLPFYFFMMLKTLFVEVL